MQGQRKQTKAKNAPYGTSLAVQLTGYTSPLNLRNPTAVSAAQRCLYNATTSSKPVCVAAAELKGRHYRLF